MQKEEADLRVRKTRSALQKALIELTIEKGFANITVQDITERAIVNRSTFYRHYLDKYDLLDHFMEEVFKLINSTGSEETVGKTSQPSEATPAGVIKLLQHVQSNAAFYKAMLGKNGDPSFAVRVTQYIEKRFRLLLPKDLPANPNRPPLELSLRYSAYAGIGALLWWLENDMPYAPEQFGQWLQQYSLADISFSVDMPAIPDPQDIAFFKGRG